MSTIQRYLATVGGAVLGWAGGYWTSELFGPRVALTLGVVTLVGFLLIRHFQRHATQARERVLQAFLDRPDQRLYGLDIARLAQAKGGSIYPALAHLETEGWVLSDWEDPDGERPRRRVYWLNPNRPTHEAIR